MLASSSVNPVFPFVATVALAAAIVVFAGIGATVKRHWRRLCAVVCGLFGVNVVTSFLRDSQQGFLLTDCLGTVIAAQVAHGLLGHDAVGGAFPAHVAEGIGGNRHLRTPVGVASAPQGGLSHSLKGYTSFIYTPGLEYARG
jgi:hypothetical protein